MLWRYVEEVVVTIYKKTVYAPRRDKTLQSSCRLSDACSPGTPAAPPAQTPRTLTHDVTLPTSQN